MSVKVFKPQRSSSAVQNKTSSQMGWCYSLMKTCKTHVESDTSHTGHCIGIGTSTEAEYLPVEHNRLFHRMS